MGEKKEKKENSIEMYSRWYFEELKNYGYITKVDPDPKQIEVYSSAKYRVLKRFKKKGRPPEPEEKVLFSPIRYTADIVIIWHPSARYLFFDALEPENDFIFKYGRPLFLAHKAESGDYYSVFDVKPPHTVAAFGKTSSSITFPIKQRIIYEDLGVYVNKFVPIPMAGAYKNSAVFINSFTPTRYLVTDKTLVARKIAWQTRSIEAYIKQRASEVSVLNNSDKP